MNRGVRLCQLFLFLLYVNDPANKLKAVHIEIDVSGCFKKLRTDAGVDGVDCVEISAPNPGGL